MSAVNRQADPAQLSIDRSDQSNEVCLELDTKDKVPTDVTSNFSVMFVWKPTTFERYDQRPSRAAAPSSRG